MNTWFFRTRRRSVRPLQPSPSSGVFGFMATPLAQVSTSSNTSNFTRQPPSTKSDVVDLPALQSASRVLVEQLAKDAQIIPDIGETLTSRMSSFFPLLRQP
jgi:hypothetical protein